MRAVCESCAQPQPVDWRAGDLCVHCGLAVREEARCYWCAKWGPLAKFCRKCGAAAANRIVEDVRALGQSLYQKHWADEMEDEIIPELPWSDEKLSAYSAAPLSEASPFARVRDLAHLVRIHRGDFSELRQCTHLIHSDDPAIAADAALQFSGWRALYCIHTEASRHDLIAVLRQFPLPAHAAPRLAPNPGQSIRSLAMPTPTSSF